jgi:Ala-tRNA(Pro) deacylase
MTSPLTKDLLLARLHAMGLKTETFEHPPIFTVEDGREHWQGIPGLHCKNLFLKDAKGQMWLVSAPIDRAIDLKKLPDRIGSARLSFGSAERLRATLSIEPGSVTPFALANDPEGKVILVLDKAMMSAPLLAFHPLVNTATTVLAPAALMAFLESTGHRPTIAAL